MSEHINIKAMAMDKVFKVRFHAMGTNSINILSWFVDNVHIYRTCDAPTELTAEAIWAAAGHCAELGRARIAEYRRMDPLG